jgi:hypothetical protein
MAAEPLGASRTLAKGSGAIEASRSAKSIAMRHV